MPGEKNMKTVCLVVMLAASMVWMSMGELSAAEKEVCPECEREAGAFITGYKQFWMEKGANNTTSPDSKKAKKAKKTLFNCLRYYGYSGADADGIIQELSEIAEAEVKAERRL